MKPTIIRRLGDQFSAGPMGVLDQSLARMSAPISPLLSSKPAAWPTFIPITPLPAFRAPTDKA
jgi:hypothetical protein